MFLATVVLLGVASLGFAASGCKPDKNTKPTQGGDHTVCDAKDCGPKPGMPNEICPDGVTMSGPGECVATEYGCAWDIVKCPKVDGVGEACGGISGKQCPVGQTCVDDPNDTCDPNSGGADCGGICQSQY